MKYGHVRFYERWPLLTIHSPVWHNKWIKKNKVDALDLCKINLQKTNFPLSSNLSSNSWQGYDGLKMHHIKKTYECVLEQENPLFDIPIWNILNTCVDAKNDRWVISKGLYILEFWRKLDLYIMKNLEFGELYIHFICKNILRTW